MGLGIEKEKHEVMEYRGQERIQSTGEVWRKKEKEVVDYRLRKNTRKC